MITEIKKVCINRKCRHNAIMLFGEHVKYCDNCGRELKVRLIEK